MKVALVEFLVRIVPEQDNPPNEVMDTALDIVVNKMKLGAYIQGYANTALDNVGYDALDGFHVEVLSDGDVWRRQSSLASKLTARDIAWALSQCLEADSWGDVDPWWIKRVAEAPLEDPEDDHYEQVEALRKVFERAAEMLNRGRK